MLKRILGQHEMNYNLNLIPLVALYNLLSYLILKKQ
jgi:hypothetical protein